MRVRANVKLLCLWADPTTENGAQKGGVCSRPSFRRCSPHSEAGGGGDPSAPERCRGLVGKAEGASDAASLLSPCRRYPPGVPPAVQQTTPSIGRWG